MHNAKRRRRRRRKRSSALLSFVVLKRTTRSFPALSFFCLFFCYSSTHSAKRRRIRTTHLSPLSLFFGVLLQRSYMKKTTMRELSTLSLSFFLVAVQHRTQRGGQRQWLIQLRHHHLLFCYNIATQRRQQHESVLTSSFFLLQLNIEHKEEKEDDDNTLECIIIVIYCFVIVEVHEKENDAKMFSRHHFIYFCYSSM